MDECVLRWDGFSVVVRFGYDEAANAELRRVCPQARWNPDAGGFVTRVDAGMASVAVLDFAARRGLTVSIEAAALLDPAARRAREAAARPAAREAEQAAWEARPPRRIALVRKLIGPVVWLDRFACPACDDHGASGWPLPPERGGGAGYPVGCELRHLVTSVGRRRITTAEYEALVAVLDNERLAGGAASRSSPRSRLLFWAVRA